MIWSAADLNRRWAEGVLRYPYCFTVDQWYDAMAILLAERAPA